MANRSKKKKKPVVNKELAIKIKRLEQDIRDSLDEVDGTSESVDNLFKNQAKRLQLELNKLKENQ